MYGAVIEWALLDSLPVDAQNPKGFEAGVRGFDRDGFRAGVRVIPEPKSGIERIIGVRDDVGCNLERLQQPLRDGAGTARLNGGDGRLANGELEDQAGTGNGRSGGADERLAPCPGRQQEQPGQENEFFCHGQCMNGVLPVLSRSASRPTHFGWGFSDRSPAGMACPFRLLSFRFVTGTGVFLQDRRLSAATGSASSQRRYAGAILENYNQLQKKSKASHRKSIHFQLYLFPNPILQ